MSWQFTDWHLIRRFLQLENLLVDELRLFMGDNIGIKRAFRFRFITRLRLASTPPRKGKPGESTINPDVLAVVAVFAANVDYCCFGGYCRSTDYDAGNTDEV
jgi:hypothetical protein